MGHETHMLVHVPSKTIVNMIHGVRGDILHRLLEAKGWKLCDVHIFDDRWDEMPDNLADVGVTVPEEDAQEWFYNEFTEEKISAILPSVFSGRG